MQHLELDGRGHANRIQLLISDLERLEPGRMTVAVSATIAIIVIVLFLIVVDVVVEIVIIALHFAAVV